jgi:hypothetical protein
LDAPKYTGIRPSSAFLGGAFLRLSIPPVLNVEYHIQLTDSIVQLLGMATAATYKTGRIEIPNT